jgi:hypothetical protein
MYDLVSPFGGGLRGRTSAPRIKDLGTRCTKIRRNFELFDDAGGVFKIPALRTKLVRSFSSPRPFFVSFSGQYQKRKIF